MQDHQSQPLEKHNCLKIQVIFIYSDGESEAFPTR